MPKVLIVVDMQRDFVDQNGALAIPGDNTKLINNISNYIKNFNGKVFYTLDTHEEDSCEFQAFPKHCISGTDGWRLTDKIAHAIYSKEQGTQRVIHKLGKASFGSHDIARYILAAHKDSEIHVVGVCTHICVHDIVADIVNEFKNKINKIPIIKIDKSLVGDFDPEMAEFALKRLSNLYGVEVV